MDREWLEELSTTELEDLRSEIDLLLTQRRVSGTGESGRSGGPINVGNSGREIIQERSSEHGILRREVATGPDGPTEEPRWHLYYYTNTKAGKRRLISEDLGPELPEEYRD